MFWCKKERRRPLGGYFTVEASLLMGIVVTILVFVIYLGFFQYDRCVLAQDTYLLCFRTSLLREGGDTEKLKEMAPRQYGSKYFFTGSIKTDADVRGGKVICRTSAVFHNRIFQDALPGGSWNISAASSAAETDPALHIRRHRRLRALISYGGRDK